MASRKWWELDALELVLLSQLINSLPPCSSRDIPVFLPKTSPKVKLSNIPNSPFRYDICFVDIENTMSKKWKLCCQTAYDKQRRRRKQLECVDKNIAQVYIYP